MITMASKRTECQKRFPVTSANVAKSIICRISQQTVVKNFQTAGSDDKKRFTMAVDAFAGRTSTWGELEAAGTRG